ncbi:MAG: Exonuclease SbcC, partial [Candidatus Daviesbacteria bacterium GW2011_GWB1_41_5]
LSQKEERSEKKKEAEGTIAKVETEIKSLEEKLKLLQTQRETLKITSEQRKKIEQNFLQNKKELEEILLQGKSRKEKIDLLKSNLEKLKGAEIELSRLKELQTEKEKMDQERNKKLETEKSLSEITGQINLKKQKAQQLKNEGEKLKLQIKKSSEIGAKCPTCGQEIGKDEKAHVHKELSTQIEVLQKELAKIDYADEEKKSLIFQKTLKSLTFDFLKYQALAVKLQGLETAQQQKEQMLQIQATLQSEEKIVLEMRTLFVNKKSQVEALEKELADLPDQLDKLVQLDQLVLISRTAQMEKLQKAKNEEKNILQKDKENFEELSLAFGKKGIQAMIIETAIPEIEDEANRLLDKLSDGRMKIRFETQKETKTKIAGTGEKGIIETLDIIISDEMGDRPYEGYSGGEQFRVNFAIRLALSKLLTHRAGAKLQFLVIDEGFGTQDAQGRSRVVEALNAIKDDFEKILVITHLEELKEEFPVRVEVQKGPSGSTFEVVGT